MNKLIKKVSLLTLLAALALTFTACGGGGTPEEVAEKYMKAVLNSDYGTMKKFSSEKNKASVEKEEEQFKTKGVPAEKKELVDKLKSYTPKAEEAKISEDGNSATVRVPLLNKDGKEEMKFKVSLVKENDAWKVNSTSK